MTRLTVLYKSDPERGKVWNEIFAAQGSDFKFLIWPDCERPEEVDYIVAWKLPDGFPQRFPNVKAVFSVGAGVDNLDMDQIPSSLPIVRMVEPGIISGMTEYATMAVLMMHRNMVDYIAWQQAAIWKKAAVLSAKDRRIGILGLGMLGQELIKSLLPLGFQLAGWSRSAKYLNGVECYHGNAMLSAFLQRTDILVCLLPLTSQTSGILNMETMRQLPRGASVINVGRGAHLVENDLITLLDSGHLTAAMLDVFSEEPLPGDHRFWNHPRIVMTPHIASRTQPETAAMVLIDNLKRHQSGETMIGLFERSREY